MLGLKLNHVSKRGYWWPSVPTQQWPTPLLDVPQVKYWNAWLADISLPKYPLSMLNAKSRNPLDYVLSAILPNVKFCKLLAKNVDALAERHATCANNVMCPSVLNLVLSYITPSRSTFLLTDALSSRKSKRKPIHIYCWIIWVPFSSRKSKRKPIHIYCWIIWVPFSSRKSKRKPIHIYCWIIWVPFSSRKSKRKPIHTYCWIIWVPFYYQRLTLISAWINNHNHLKCGMKMLIHFHTTIFAQLKFGNG